MWTLHLYLSRPPDQVHLLRLLARLISTHLLRLHLRLYLSIGRFIYFRRVLILVRCDELRRINFVFYNGSGNNSVLMEHHSQNIQRSISAPAPAAELDDETVSPSTEMAEESLSSLSSNNESVNSSAARSHRQHGPHQRNPPTSLPVQLSYDRPNVKHPLQHQISAPVTVTEVASSRRYSRPMSRKELIKE